eukprot:6176520-Pleurochrysis_carterae.AAC.1
MSAQHQGVQLQPVKDARNYKTFDCAQIEQLYQSAPNQLLVSKANTCKTGTSLNRVLASRQLVVDFVAIAMTNTTRFCNPSGLSWLSASYATCTILSNVAKGETPLARAYKPARENRLVLFVYEIYLYIKCRSDITSISLLAPLARLFTTSLPAAAPAAAAQRSAA